MKGPSRPLPEGCEARCRACRHRGWSAEESESQKASFLASKLAGWKEALRPVQGTTPDLRLGYRRKSCLHAAWDHDEKRWRFGLLALASREYRDYELIPIPTCPVHHPELNPFFEELARQAPDPERLPLAFVAVSGPFATLVLKSARLPDLSWLDPESLGMEGLFVNLNPSAGRRVFSSRGWKHVWGRTRAKTDGPENRLVFGPESFQQLIPALYRQALEEGRGFLRPDSSSTVIDLCSGIGASLMLWKMSGARTLGVELGRESSECAQANSGEGTCLRGRASERIPQLDAFAKEQTAGERLLFANPPRTGLEKKVIRWIASSLRPSRIAYLSCSAGTLARDLDSLSEAGYRVCSLTPYDFFPGTHHVEVLACLELSTGQAGRATPS